MSSDPIYVASSGSDNEDAHAASRSEDEELQRALVASRKTFEQSRLAEYGMPSKAPAPPNYPKPVEMVWTGSYAEVAAKAPSTPPLASSSSSVAAVVAASDDASSAPVRHSASGDASSGDASSGDEVSSARDLSPKASAAAAKKAFEDQQKKELDKQILSLHAEHERTQARIYRLRKENQRREQKMRRMQALRGRWGERALSELLMGGFTIIGDPRSPRPASTDQRPASANQCLESAMHAIETAMTAMGIDKDEVPSKRRRYSSRSSSSDKGRRRSSRSSDSEEEFEAAIMAAEEYNASASPKASAVRRSASDEVASPKASDDEEEFAPRQVRRSASDEEEEVASSPMASPKASDDEEEASSPMASPVRHQKRRSASDDEEEASVRRQKRRSASDEEDDVSSCGQKRRNEEGRLLADALYDLAEVRSALVSAQSMAETMTSDAESLASLRAMQVVSSQPVQVVQVFVPSTLNEYVHPLAATPAELSSASAASMAMRDHRRKAIEEAKTVRQAAREEDSDDDDSEFGAKEKAAKREAAQRRLRERLGVYASARAPHGVWGVPSRTQRVSVDVVAAAPRSQVLYEKMAQATDEYANMAASVRELEQSERSVIERHPYLTRACEVLGRPVVQGERIYRGDQLQVVQEATRVLQKRMEEAREAVALESCMTPPLTTPGAHPHAMTCPCVSHALLFAFGSFAAFHRARTMSEIDARTYAGRVLSDFNKKMRDHPYFFAPRTESDELAAHEMKLCRARASELVRQWERINVGEYVKYVVSQYYDFVLSMARETHATLSCATQWARDMTEEAKAAELFEKGVRARCLESKEEWPTTQEAAAERVAELFMERAMEHVCGMARAREVDLLASPETRVWVKHQVVSVLLGREKPAATKVLIRRLRSSYEDDGTGVTFALLSRMRQEISRVRRNLVRALLRRGEEVEVEENPVDLDAYTVACALMWIALYDGTQSPRIIMHTMHTAKLSPVTHAVPLPGGKGVDHFFSVLMLSMCAETCAPLVMFSLPTDNFAAAIQARRTLHEVAEDAAAAASSSSSSSSSAAAAAAASSAAAAASSSSAAAAAAASSSSSSSSSASAAAVGASSSSSSTAMEVEDTEATKRYRAMLAIDPETEDATIAIRERVKQRASIMPAEYEVNPDVCTRTLQEREVPGLTRFVHARTVRPAAVAALASLATGELQQRLEALAAEATQHVASASAPVKQMPSLMAFVRVAEELIMLRSTHAQLSSREFDSDERMAPTELMRSASDKRLFATLQHVEEQIERRIRCLERLRPEALREHAEAVKYARAHDSALADCAITNSFDAAAEALTRGVMCEQPSGPATKFINAVAGDLLALYYHVFTTVDTLQFEWATVRDNISEARKEVEAIRASSSSSAAAAAAEASSSAAAAEASSSSSAAAAAAGLTVEERVEIVCENLVRDGYSYSPLVEKYVRGDERITLEETVAGHFFHNTQPSRAAWDVRNALEDVNARILRHGDGLNQRREELAQVVNTFQTTRTAPPLRTWVPASIARVQQQEALKPTPPTASNPLDFRRGSLKAPPNATKVLMSAAEAATGASAFFRHSLTSQLDATTALFALFLQLYEAAAPLLEACHRISDDIFDLRPVDISMPTTAETTLWIAYGKALRAARELDQAPGNTISYLCDRVKSSAAPPSAHDDFQNMLPQLWSYLYLGRVPPRPTSELLGVYDYHHVTASAFARFVEWYAPKAREIAPRALSVSDFADTVRRHYDIKCGSEPSDRLGELVSAMEFKFNITFSYAPVCQSLEDIFAAVLRHLMLQADRMYNFPDDRDD